MLRIYIFLIASAVALSGCTFSQYAEEHTVGFNKLMHFDIGECRMTFRSDVDSVIIAKGEGPIYEDVMHDFGVIQQYDQGAQYRMLVMPIGYSLEEMVYLAQVISDGQVISSRKTENGVKVGVEIENDKQAQWQFSQKQNLVVVIEGVALKSEYTSTVIEDVERMSAEADDSQCELPGSAI